VVAAPVRNRSMVSLMRNVEAMNNRCVIL
jgi:hypothetical protein